MRGKGFGPGRSFHLLLALVLALGAAWSAAPVRAASATVSAIAIEAGNTITVRGSGFREGERVSSWASSAGGDVVATGIATVDDGGDVTFSVLARRSWAPGWWAISLRGLATNRKAVATFEVLPAKPSGVLDVSPASVPPGERITFHGSGFVGGETIFIWATRPDGSTHAFEEYPKANKGEVWFRFRLPRGAPAGQWSMSAYGERGDRLLVATFMVAP